MLEVVVWVFWFLLGAYAFWFLFGAKTFQPLSLDDLALTWKLHKHQAGCKAARIRELLVKNDQVVGFKCDCGYEYLQKRLITQKPHNQAHVERLAFTSKTTLANLVRQGSPSEDSFK
jgi:hypothetical protein